MAEGMSLAEFGQIAGLSRQGVRKAIETGRIVQAASRNARGHRIITDAALARRELDANSNPAMRRKPLVEVGGTVAEYRDRLERFARWWLDMTLDDLERCHTVEDLRQAFDNYMLAIAALAGKVPAVPCDEAAADELASSMLWNASGDDDE